MKNNSFQNFQLEISNISDDPEQTERRGQKKAKSSTVKVAFLDPLIRLKRSFGKPTTYHLFLGDSSLHENAGPSLRERTRVWLCFLRALPGSLSRGFRVRLLYPLLIPAGRLFRPENVYVGDGENMISNPNYEWGKLMDFLRLEKDYFQFFVPEEKGFPCLEMPIRHCLNAAKGIIRKHF